MNTLKQKLTLGIPVFLLLFCLLAPLVRAEDPLRGATGQATGGADPTDVSTYKTKGLLYEVTPKCVTEGECSFCDFLQVVVNIGNFILAISGALALLFFIWGAWGFIMARGDDEKITSAKDTIWQSLAGMVFVLISWEIVATVLFILTNNHNPFVGICNFNG